MSTPVSAHRVPIATPADLRWLIRIRFTTTSMTAPTISEIKTLFSFPKGIKICMPKILVKPINKTVGIIICIGSVAGSYSDPDKNTILVLENIIKYTTNGSAIKTTKLMALEQISLNSSIIPLET